MSALAEMIPFLSSRKNRHVYVANSVSSYNSVINAGLIVPIGDIDSALLIYIAEKLSVKFNLLFSLTRQIAVPTQAYNKYRNQFLSVSILNSMNKKYNYAKVLGIINEDIYISELDFIFGESHIRGRSALISLKRLKEEYYGKVPNTELLKERALKETIHELGHTFGIHHCMNYKCVMFFSKSISDTDNKKVDFCENCLQQIS